MKSPNATAQSTFKLESVLYEASTGKDSGCTWPSKHTNDHRSQMMEAWQNSGTIRQVRGEREPRSVLNRLLAMPAVASSPVNSPRRRCSAASASLIAMVHSPRTFVNSDNRLLEKRDPTAQTMPYSWCSAVYSATEFESYDSSSNCSSSQCSSPIPINQFPDHPIPSDDESEDEVLILRQQVALLVKSLEHEKKRRASEQHLMQTKIIELQSFIRANGHENGHDPMPMASSSNKRPSEISQLRQWSGSMDEDEEVNSSSCGYLEQQLDSNGEAPVELQLSQFRAQMHAIVLDSQRETQILRAQVESLMQNQTKREKQLTLEATSQVTALEKKHIAATTHLVQQVANSAAQVEMLQREKGELLTRTRMQQERLMQLERGLGDKQIEDDSR